MLVTTDFVRPSGKGTAMFSKIGGLTSFQYGAFENRTYEKKEKPLDKEFTGRNEYLP